MRSQEISIEKIIIYPLRGDELMEVNNNEEIQRNRGHYRKH